MDHYEANELQCLTWYGKEDGKVLVRAAIIPNKNRFRVLAEGAAEWKANLDMNTVVIQAMLENLQSRVALFANAFVGKLGENVEIDVSSLIRPVPVIHSLTSHLTRPTRSMKDSRSKTLERVVRSSFAMAGC